MIKKSTKTTVNEFCALQMSCAACKSKCQEYKEHKRFLFSSEITEVDGKFYRVTPLSFPREIEVAFKKEGNDIVR